MLRVTLIQAANLLLIPANIKTMLVLQPLRVPGTRVVVEVRMRCRCDEGAARFAVRK